MKLKASIIMVIIILGFGWAFLQWSVHRPIADEFDGRRIIINPGTSSEQIGQILKKEKIISNRYVFDYYVWRSGLDDSLQAGEYVLSPSMTIPEIARALSGGEAISNDIIVTIPEGFTLQQIAERLVVNGVVDSVDEFLETWVDTSSFPFLSVRGERLQVRELEGYMFPETYRFEPGESPTDLATRLLKEFDERIARPFALEFSESGFEFEDILTMGSLIEDEVRSEEDRMLVSGIIRTRLSIGMALQIDATIVYSTGRRVITSEDLRVQSDYNTYLYRGLPPGPINNPGVSAVRAALRPQDSDFLYYLSKPSGETVFSETLDQHNTAKAKYLR